MGVTKLAANSQSTGTPGRNTGAVFSRRNGQIAIHHDLIEAIQKRGVTAHRGAKECIELV